MVFWSENEQMFLHFTFLLTKKTFNVKASYTSSPALQLLQQHANKDPPPSLIERKTMYKTIASIASTNICIFYEMIPYKVHCFRQIIVSAKCAVSTSRDRQ